MSGRLNHRRWGKKKVKTPLIELSVFGTQVGEVFYFFFWDGKVSTPHPPTPPPHRRAGSVADGSRGLRWKR